MLPLAGQRSRRFRTFGSGILAATLIFRYAVGSCWGIGHAEITSFVQRCIRAYPCRLLVGHGARNPDGRGPDRSRDGAEIFQEAGLLALCRT